MLVHTVSIVFTQVNDKDVMLITSRSMVQPTLIHGALKLGQGTIIYTRPWVWVPCTVKRGEELCVLLYAWY